MNHAGLFFFFYFATQLKISYRQQCLGSGGQFLWPTFHLGTQKKASSPSPDCNPVFHTFISRQTPPPGAAEQASKFKSHPHTERWVPLSERRSRKMGSEHGGGGRGRGRFLPDVTHMCSVNRMLRLIRTLLLPTSNTAIMDLTLSAALSSYFSFLSACTFCLLLCTLLFSGSKA